MYIREQLQQLIETNRQIYRLDPTRIIGDYRSEKEYTKDYNGRQLLELLQNAEDASCREVHLYLDTVNKTLTIANDGNPFIIDGVRSLLIAHVSPKDKRYFIGNKGLGFRAILNWASSITIRSAGFAIRFSEANARRELEVILPDPADRQALAKGRPIAPGEVLFPVLGIPELLDTPAEATPLGENSEGHPWATVIELHYRPSFETDIIRQLQDISPEILLFLNAITRIGLVHDDASRVLSKQITKSGGNTLVAIDGRSWQLTEQTGTLAVDDITIYSQAPSYQLKLAWGEGLPDRSPRLFSYFPTQLSLHLPCLIHGTFELDIARNHLTDGPLNRRLLQLLAELIIQQAKKMTIGRQQTAVESTASWMPWLFLTPAGGIPDLPLLQDFYQVLLQAQAALPFYPCVDGSYRPLADCYGYTPAFSRWVSSIGASIFFPELLLSPEKRANTETWQSYCKPYPARIFRERINALSVSGLLSEDVRIQLIGLLLEPAFKTEEPLYYDLLIDTEGRLIPATVTAFTPPIQSEEQLESPAFVQIAFIHPTFYQRLLLRYRKQFNQGDDIEARRFRAYFAGILNIQPYDSNTVLTRIIHSTRDAVRAATPGEALTLVRELVLSLYKSYCTLRSKKEVFSEPCLLITGELIVQESSKLFLSPDLPSGALVAEIYEGVLRPADFMASPSLYDLPGDIEPAILEAFFIWLGVNRFVQFERIEKTIERWQEPEEPYVGLVYTQFSSPPPHTRTFLDVLAIERLEHTLGRLSLQKQLLIILKEEKIRSRLNLDNDDKVTYQQGQVYPQIPSKPSYLFFQLTGLLKLESYLVHTEGIVCLRPAETARKLDPGFFQRYQVAEEAVYLVLSQLGAKNSFMALSTEQVYQLLLQTPTLDPQGREITRIYRLALNNFRSQEQQRPFPPPGLQIFARKNGAASQGAYLPAASVYYADNDGLPEKIRKDYPVMVFPKRGGEQQIRQYFGVRNFTELQLQIEEGFQPVPPVLQTKLNGWLQTISPVILAHRLLETRQKKAEAALLRRLQIHFVRSLDYIVEGRRHTLSPNEFISDQERFYFATDHTTLSEMQSDPFCCDRIAEIFCLRLKVNQHGIFRTAFKDPLTDTLHLLQSNEELYPLYEEALGLLGITTEELRFWKATAQVCGFTLPETLTQPEELSSWVYQTLGFSLSSFQGRVDYLRFATTDSIRFLEDLCRVTGISLWAIHAADDGFPGLADWWAATLREAAIDAEARYGRVLWESLLLRPREEQAQYLQCRGLWSFWLQAFEESRPDAAFQLQIDYPVLLQKLIKQKSGLTLPVGSNEPTAVFLQYPDLAEELEELQISLPSEQKSLFYFPGHELILRSYLDAYRNQPTGADPSDGAGPAAGTPPLPIVLTTIAALPATAIDSPRSKSHRVRNYNPDQQRRQRRAGKKAERAVRDALISTYGATNVQWISSSSDEAMQNDAAGYDLRYREDASAPWYYLEVKSVSGNTFILTENELLKALETPERYHLALVHEGEIRLVKDFFRNPQFETDFQILRSGRLLLPFDYELQFKWPDS